MGSSARWPLQDPSVCCAKHPVRDGLRLTPASPAALCCGTCLLHQTPRNPSSKTDTQIFLENADIFFTVIFTIEVRLGQRAAPLACSSARLVAALPRCWVMSVRQGARGQRLLGRCCGTRVGVWLLRGRSRGGGGARGDADGGWGCCSSSSTCTRTWCGPSFQTAGRCSTPSLSLSGTCPCRLGAHASGAHASCTILAAGLAARRPATPLPCERLLQLARRNAASPLANCTPPAP